MTNHSCAINGNYILLATQRALALNNYLLDPSNECIFFILFYRKGTYASAHR
jgi:hypothetical protein